MKPMIPVTITLVLLHLVLIVKLLVNRRAPRTANTMGEPTVLQIVVCTACILLMSVAIQHWLLRLTAAGITVLLMDVVRKKKRT